MLEARLNEAGTLKKLLDAIKELVTDANFECNEEGINLQAMDNSHVALVAVKLDSDGFRKYRCDRPMPLGVNLASLTKVLKCAKDDDSCTLKAGDDADVLNLIYEAKNSDRIAEYEMKLMDIDSDTLGIPDTDYDARVTMAAAEFTRIVRDLSQLGESVRIDVNKEGVRFASDGEAANGNVLLKQTEVARELYRDYLKKEEDDDAAEEEEEEEDEDAEKKDDDDEEGGEEEDGEAKPKIKKEKKIKTEKKKGAVKKEKKNEDGDVDMDDEEEFKPESDEEEKNEDEDDEDEEKNKKKRKKAPAKAKAAPAKKARTKKTDDDDGPSGGVSIEMNSAVSLTFSLKYLVNFSKSASLSQTVQLMMSNDVPLLVSYDFGPGHIRYYLAPKIGDD